MSYDDLWEHRGADTPMRPDLVQFADLTERHFVRSPVWAACSSFDYDEPWYDETDEETFRPWAGPLPVSPRDGMFLVKAMLKLADGTMLSGFGTPCVPEDVGAGGGLGIMQPHVFTPVGGPRGFWYGMIPISTEGRAAFYMELGKSAMLVFPISFACVDGLAAGVVSGALQGFYSVMEANARPTIST